MAVKHSLEQKCLIRGDTKINKSLPYAKIFFLSLMDNIFIICNLKVTKNNRNTYYNMHFDKQLTKSTQNIFQATSPEAICVAIYYHVCQLIADTKAYLSSLKLGNKLK